MTQVEMPKAVTGRSARVKGLSDIRDRLIAASVVREDTFNENIAGLWRLIQQEWMGEETSRSDETRGDWII